MSKLKSSLRHSGLSRIMAGRFWSPLRLASLAQAPQNDNDNCYNIFMISEDQLTEYIFLYKLRLPKFSFDKITPEEKEIILSAGKNFGFEADFKGQSFKGQSLKGPVPTNYDAALIVKGEYSVKSSGVLETDEGKINLNFFIYHFTSSNLRFKAIAKELINKKLVKLFPGCDEE